MALEGDDPEGSSVAPLLLSEEGALRMLQQAFDLWVHPEVQKRKNSGALPKQFQLTMAQRIQFPDGRISVRLNDEVRGVASIRSSRQMQAGDSISLADMAGIEQFDIPDDELDAGHLTMIWTGSSWFVSFNFLSNRAKCRSLLEKASEFLDVAKIAKDRNSPTVAVDTLFSACELISKAALVSASVISIDVKTHGQIASKINHWRKLGNVEGAFVDLFNKLNNLRPRFRYDAEFSDLMPISDDDFDLVGVMIALGIERVRASHDKLGL